MVPQVADSCVSQRLFVTSQYLFGAHDCSDGTPFEHIKYKLQSLGCGKKCTPVGGHETNGGSVGGGYIY